MAPPAILPPQTLADLQTWVLVMHSAKYPRVCCYCHKAIQVGQMEFWARKDGHTLRWHGGCDIRVPQRQVEVAS